MRKSNPIVEYAYEVLNRQKDPMHVKDLTAAMQEAGWQSDLKKPVHVVYTTLHGLVQRQGEACNFRFVGDGKFTTVDIAESEDLEVKEIAPRDPGATVYKAKTTIAPENRKCGNCIHLDFHGLEEISQNFGRCERYQDSNHLSRRSKDAACPFWEQISVARLAALRERAINLKAQVAGFNVSVKRTKLSPRDFGGSN